MCDGTIARSYDRTIVRQNMKLSDFNYEHPKELIAQHPLAERDASRMMVVSRASQSWQHSNIKELPNFLKAGDLLVLNDSRVIPARIFGKRGTGENLEVLVIEKYHRVENTWRCLLKKAKRIRAGEKFFFGMQSTAKAIGRDGTFLLLEFKGKSLELAIKHHGVPPLPPYIEREGFDAYSNEDRERYQTVYAKKLGSSAAPTAGLHLSDKLLGQIENSGIEIVHVTLHVGIDTFAPVRADTIAEHKMHGEHVEIPEETAKKIGIAKKEGRRVVAVGTTTTRVLESAAQNEYSEFDLRRGEWTTELFITPGYKFKVVDAMLTNFHQPRSTLLMMVSAFASREFILKCYEEAIKERYRLFSFGDCMLIL